MVPDGWIAVPKAGTKVVYNKEGSIPLQVKVLDIYLASDEVRFLHKVLIALDTNEKVLDWVSLHSLGEALPGENFEIP